MRRTSNRIDLALMYHSSAVVQGHRQKWGQVVHPAANEKTSELLFWFPPERAGQELATTFDNNQPARHGESNRRSGSDLGQLAIGARVRTVVHAIPVALGAEIDRGTVFLFLPVFAAFGTVTYFNCAVEPKLSAIVSGLTVLFGCYMLAQARPIIRLVVLFALAIVCGMLFAKMETIRADTAMLGSEVTTRVTGRVSGMAKDAKGGWRLILDVIATERPALRFGPDRIIVSARTVPRDIKVGDGLKGLVHLRPQSGPMRPGNYDFAFYNYYRGIGANGFMLGKPERVEVPSKSGPVAAVLLRVATIRQQLTQRILNNIKGEPGDIATSLITGQRDGISDTTNEAMRLSGLSHVLSISGFHMALVAATIIGSLRAIMAFFPGISSRYPVKKFSAVIALFGSAFYLLLSGADVAAQRSFVMLAVMLLAMTADRAAISMRNLAIAACLTIAISPHEILGPSFQMSYSATAALIAFYGWWSDRQAKRAVRLYTYNHWLLALPEKALSHVGAIAMTSLVAGTASSIFAAYHFNNTAPFGLIGNALALPVLSVLVMPFAVLGLLAMPFELDWLPFAVMGRGIDVVIIIAKMVASQSPSGNLGLMPQTTLLLMSIGLVLLLFLSTFLRLCGIPLLVLAGLVMVCAQEPAVIISEDAKLVALRTAENNLAINRAAASAFNLNNWQQGYGAGEIIKPTKGISAKDTQFECEEKLCTAREPGGLVVAYTDDPSRMKQACEEGDIVVLAFSAKGIGCPDAKTMVVTKRDLAMHGALEITLNDPAQGSTMPASTLTQHDSSKMDDAFLTRLHTAISIHAVGAPVRPWNVYRNHSRASRNLAEYEPRRRNKPVNSSQ